METIDRIRFAALEVLRPPVEAPLAQWIEQNIFLPSTASATPGRMNLYAYQRGICDALDDPSISEIVISKSARVGFTALLSGYIGHCVAVNPAPILVTQPTTDDSRAFSVDTEALFEASQNLRGLISDDADETGRSTMMRRLYPGGSLEFLSASSPRAFRRKLGKVAIADEIDAYPPTEEGSVLDLLKMRTQTYRDRKLIYGGTPIFDYGPVTKLYEQSDRRIFEVKCVECHDFAEIIWKDLKFDPENLEKPVEWCCPNCGCLIPESRKSEMVDNGRWRATAPENKSRAGFRINSLISPHYNARWSALVAEFMEAKRSPETLQSFVNLVLGEPWRTEGESFDEDSLYATRESFSLDNIPEDVLWLTLGIDCQDSRLEGIVMGHGQSGSLYVLSHEVWWGQIDGEDVWGELDSFLRQTWSHPTAGATLKIEACCIDEGSGGHVEYVRAFTRHRWNRRITAIKGVGGFSRPHLERSGAKGLQLWIAGVDALKSGIFARLSRGNGIHFSETLTPTYFEQLTSERRQVIYSKGQPQARFVRLPGRAAEGLDATAYAWAAARLINVKPEIRAGELASAAAPKPKAPQIIRSKWIGG